MPCINVAFLYCIMSIMYNLCINVASFAVAGSDEAIFHHCKDGLCIWKEQLWHNILQSLEKMEFERHGKYFFWITRWSGRQRSWNSIPYLGLAAFFWECCWKFEQTLTKITNFLPKLTPDMWLPSSREGKMWTLLVAAKSFLISWTLETWSTP